MRDPAGTDLNGWSIELYNGNGGTLYDTNYLSETISDQDNGFGTVAGLDVNLNDNRAVHSSTNETLSWTDTLNTIENVTGTQRNDRFIGNSGDNVFDRQGQIGRDDRQTVFTSLDGEYYRVTADVVEYEGSQSDFNFMGSGDNLTVSGNNEGTDTLINIEFVQFNADSSVVSTNDLAFG